MSDKRWSAGDWRLVLMEGVPFLLVVAALPASWLAAHSGGDRAFLAVLWSVVGLTWLAAVAMVVRPMAGCLRMLLPALASLEIAAATAALPEVVGWQVPVAQAAALVVLVAGWRLQPGRRPARRTPQTS